MKGLWGQTSLQICSAGLPVELKKTNPRQPTFDSDSRTFPDVANIRNRRLMIFASLMSLRFGNPGDNSFAQIFLEKYRDGVVRGFIAPEDEIRSGKLR